MSFVTHSVSLFLQGLLLKGAQGGNSAACPLSGFPPVLSSSPAIVPCVLDNSGRPDSLHAITRKHAFLLPMSSFKRQRGGTNGGNFNCSLIPAMSEHPVWPGPRACPIKMTELRTKESEPHSTFRFSGGCGQPHAAFLGG